MRRRRLSTLERRAIYERAGGCCEYCRHPFEYAPGIFQVDHIISLASGGSNDLANLALACDACNTLKWTHIQWIDTESGLKTPLFNPKNLFELVF
jgi:5-methylcytosine-specific restriction endonuclease McrA